MKKKKEALRLLEESLQELESQKGSILTAIQKISRSSALLDKDDIVKWCYIQFGNKTYTTPLKNYINLLLEINDKANDSLSEDEKRKKVLAEKEKLKKIGLDKDIHFDIEELNIKNDENGGGYNNIGFIEETYADLVRRKTGNAGGIMLPINRTT